MITLNHFSDALLLLDNPTTTLEIVGTGKYLCLRKVYFEDTRLEVTVDNKVYTFSYRPRLEVVIKLLGIKCSRRHKREIRRFLALC